MRPSVWLLRETDAQFAGSDGLEEKGLRRSGKEKALWEGGLFAAPSSHLNLYLEADPKPKTRLCPPIPLITPLYRLRI
jgi:hypothetical protein